MKRCLFALLATLTLLLGLSSCAGNDQKPSVDPTQEVLTWQEQYDLGIRYLSEGNYEEAIIAFTAAIEIDPKRAPAYVGRGDAYILSGETDENLMAAQQDYEKAIEIDDTSPEAYLGLADVYIRCGEYDKAIEILKNGMEKTDSQAIADKITEPPLAAGIYNPGIYTASNKFGFNFETDVTATITVDENNIVSVTITAPGETEIGREALPKLEANAKDKGTDMDGVSGATLTSDAAKDAVRAALEQAKR